MKNIYLPLKVSDSAADKLDYTVQLAKCFGAKIFVNYLAYNSLPPGANQYRYDVKMRNLMEEGQSFLDSLCEKYLSESGENKSFGIETFITQSKQQPAQAFAKQAAAFNADLIVFRAKENGKSSESFGSPGIYGLAKSLKNNVLLLPAPDFKKGFSKWYFATTGEPAQEDYLEVLLSWQRIFPFELTCLHIEQGFAEQDKHFQNMKEKFAPRNPNVKYLSLPKGKESIGERINSEVVCQNVDFLVVVLNQRDILSSLFYKSTGKYLSFSPLVPTLFLH